MAGAVQITYLFDPLCGWCYGASPVIEKLVAHTGIALQLSPVGLFAGEGAFAMNDGFAAHVREADARIARMTGQVFSPAYYSNVLGDRTRRIDSGAATLALTAVALSDPGREFAALKAIQFARYVDGLDNTDPAVIATLLEGLGLHEAAARLLQPDEELHAACQNRTKAGRDEMARFGARGVPALVAGSGETRRLIPSDRLFGNADALIEALQAA